MGKTGFIETLRVVEDLSNFLRARHPFQTGSGILSDLIENKLESVFHKTDHDVSVLRSEHFQI